eukprot:scaffold1449_cov244-Pinguiococcus_pyrenoidosus.AAC.20
MHPTNTILLSRERLSRRGLLLLGLVIHGRAVEHLKPGRHLGAHPHVQIRLGRLDMVHEVAAEAHQLSNSLEKLVVGLDVVREHREADVASDILPSRQVETRQLSRSVRTKRARRRVVHSPGRLGV